MIKSIRHHEFNFGSHKIRRTAPRLARGPPSPRSWPALYMITRCQPGTPDPATRRCTAPAPALPTWPPAGSGRAAGLTPRDHVRRSAASGDDHYSTLPSYPLAGAWPAAHRRAAARERSGKEAAAHAVRTQSGPSPAGDGLKTYRKFSPGGELRTGTAAARPAHAMRLARVVDVSML